MALTLSVRCFAREDLQHFLLAACEAVEDHVGGVGSNKVVHDDHTILGEPMHATGELSLVQLREQLILRKI